MYLKQKEVKNLLKQIKRYKGYLIIDFFNKEYSKRNKTLKEKIFKLLFKMIIRKDRLFDHRIKNVGQGKALLYKMGFRNVRNYNYNMKQTLDVLFYAEL